MKGLLTQLQVIHALLIREMKTRFGEHRLGYIWALVEPVLWIATFVGIYQLIGHLAPPGISLLAYLVTGIVPFSLFRYACGQTLSSIAANRGLLFYPQIRPLDLVLARAILEAATHLVVFALLMGGAAIVDGRLRVHSVLETLLGLALTAGLGTGLGLVFCGLSVFSPTVERLYGPLLRPIFWFSAVFHSVDSVPEPLRSWMLHNPLLQAIELVRDGWFPGYNSRHVDVWYIAAWILVLLFFGLSLERVARRHLELAS